MDGMTDDASDANFYVYAFMPDGGALAAGSAVRMPDRITIDGVVVRGRKVGDVTKVETDPSGKVMVRATITDTVAAEILRAGAVGPMSIGWRPEGPSDPADLVMRPLPALPAGDDGTGRGNG